MDSSTVEPVEDDSEDRRGVERRLSTLERRIQSVEEKYSQLAMQHEIVHTKVSSIIEQMKSNFNSLEKGLQLLLERMNAMLQPSTLTEWRNEFLQTRSDVNVLMLRKNQIEGAFWLVKFLGIGGILGGALTLFKMLKG